VSGVGFDLQGRFESALLFYGDFSSALPTLSRAWNRKNGNAIL